MFDLVSESSLNQVDTDTLDIGKMIKSMGKGSKSNLTEIHTKVIS